jgi:hypothetical protein
MGSEQKGQFVDRERLAGRRRDYSEKGFSSDFLVLQGAMSPFCYRKNPRGGGGSTVDGNAAACLRVFPWTNGK